MIKILFVCHGNICRSPMAEFVFRDLVEKKGLGDCFRIASAATSAEEIGNPVHYGTREKLREVGISVQGKRAVRMKREDYEEYDYLIGMDQRNIQNMKRILGEDEQGKIWKMMDFTEDSSDIEDPWYTGNFDKTYRDVYKGCLGLLQYIMNRHMEKTTL